MIATCRGRRAHFGFPMVGMYEKPGMGNANALRERVGPALTFMGPPGERPTEQRADRAGPASRARGHPCVAYPFAP